jgi:phosphopantothenoylcysteine synthetase/decarboxylase
VDDGGTPRRAPASVLYLVVSGAPAPEGVPALVGACQAAGWRVVVFSTLAGIRFVDPAELQRLTGEPVRWEYRMPGSGAPVPPADAVLACPLTFNSVNKFAHGHADNFAVGLLCEMAGYGVPVVVVPHCKPQLASHPAFAASLDTLRGMGVRVLFDPEAPYERRLPTWSEVIDALCSVLARMVNLGRLRGRDCDRARLYRPSPAAREPG